MIVEFDEDFPFFFFSTVDVAILLTEVKMRPQLARLC